MYHHIKKLMYTVNVGTPDPSFGNMLLEQFGGANGELAAAMQYSIQGLNCDDPGLKDLLRIAGSPYGLWRDIVLTNKENISHALDRLAQAIDHLRSNLASKELEQEFQAANELYAALRKPR